VNRTTLALTLATVAAAVAIAGCGSSESSGGAYGGSGGSSTATATPSAQTGTVLTVARAAKVGPVLVDPEGFTVYDFHKDRGTTSSCYGACARVWPPLTTAGAPRTGEGANAAKLGTTKRKDGTVQVTYAGHPLYTYVADKKPGEANGNDFSSFGAQWYALRASGEEAGS
jgi:predicted lipoprotein with Yx(FWY)xxD motif